MKPYETFTLFAATITNQTGVVGNNSFILPSSLFLGNENNNNYTLSADFGNGQGWVSISSDVTNDIFYPSSGLKTIMFKAVRNTDGKTLYSHTKINIIEQATSLMRAFFSDILQFDLPNSSGDDGAQITVWYGQNNGGMLRKPLIIFKGWDAADIASLNRLMGGRSDSRYMNRKLDSVFWGGNSFRNYLTDIDSYDIIYVDYKNSLDDIRRNANLAERVIDWVNANKLGTEKNVVMGISMGGLVARYALADMTKRGKATNTRLLITHDSPHKGANIPLGLQYLIRMVDGVVLFGQDVRKFLPEYDDLVSLLDKPASQQMLIYRSLDKSNCVQNTFINDVYQPMVTFSANVPQPEYKFIATSLGSECGQAIFEPYKKLISANGSAGIIIPILFGFHSRLIARVEVNALPVQGNTSKIAYFNLTWKNKLAFFITVQKISYEYSAYAPGYQLPIDGAPGGIPPIGEDVNGSYNDKLFFPFVGSVFGLSGIFGGYINYNYSVNEPQNFAFVPTVSALDISPFNTASLTASYSGGYNPYFQSSAANYIAQETNNGKSNFAHIEFTPRNAEWLLNNMRNTPTTLNCSIGCSIGNYGLTIIGENTFCGTANYYIPSSVLPKRKRCMAIKW